MTRERRYFRKEPFMTPNNYDIYIPQSQIPANIPREDYSNLYLRLQKSMPLGKIIHINFDAEPATKSESNDLQLNTLLKVNGRKVNFK